nr:unnamed protein product [Callosobruchus analis]
MEDVSDVLVNISSDFIQQSTEIGALSKETTKSIKVFIRDCRHLETSGGNAIMCYIFILIQFCNVRKAGFVMSAYIENIVLRSTTFSKRKKKVQSKLESVVLKLMTPLSMKGHELLMDNFYNTSTLRSNRKGTPRGLVNRKLNEGDHFWYRSKQVYVYKWSDKRYVLVITIGNHPGMITIKNRMGKRW